jgi:hypothetical protein
VPQTTIVPQVVKNLTVEYKAKRERRQQAGGEEGDDEDGDADGEKESDSVTAARRKARASPEYSDDVLWALRVKRWQLKNKVGDYIFSLFFM